MTFVPVNPQRLIDTRTVGGRLSAGASRKVVVTGGPPMAPAGAAAVVLNVATTDTEAASYLTIFPTGSTRPLAPNLIWIAGETVANLAVVPVGSGGSITLFNAFGSADVVVDLQGYFIASSGPAGGEVALTPARIVDTRAASGFPHASNTLGPDSTIDIQVTGAGGVPETGVSAVILNVTATNTTAQGFLTVWAA